MFIETDNDNIVLFNKSEYQIYRARLKKISEMRAKKMFQAKTLLSYRNGIDVRWGIRQDTLNGSCKSQC